MTDVDFVFRENPTLKMSLPGKVLSMSSKRDSLKKKVRFLRNARLLTNLP